MRNSWSLVCWAAAAAAAQQPPAFDVASVKHVGDVQSVATRQGNGVRSNLQPMRITGGSVSCKASLNGILMQMWEAKPFQVQGPDWITREVYQIEARMPDGTSPAAARLMLQTLLEERLGLKFRREPKEFPVYLLVTIPGENKLEEITPTPSGFGVRFGGNSLEGIPGMPLSGLTGLLSQAAGRPVLDETGRSGYYKIKLQWAPEADSGAAGPISVDPGIIPAIRQLGLKLEPAKRTFDTFTIDKVSKEPTEN